MTDYRPATDGPPGPRRRSLAIGGVVAVVLIVLDQVTKELAESLLEHGRFVSLFGDHIGWQLVYNQGGAFGIPAPHWIFLIVTVIVVIVVARALPRTDSKVTASAYGMLLAGALGNVIDRIFRDGANDAFGGGAVVDFVAWGTFPRFNVADSAITVGFALLVIGLWREERSHADETRAAEALARGASEGTGVGHVKVLTPTTDPGDEVDGPDADDVDRDHPDDGDEAESYPADVSGGGDAPAVEAERPAVGDAEPPAVGDAEPPDGAADEVADEVDPDDSSRT